MGLGCGGGGLVGEGDGWMGGGGMGGLQASWWVVVMS